MKILKVPKCPEIKEEQILSGIFPVYLNKAEENKNSVMHIQNHKKNIWNLGPTFQTW